MELAEYRLKLRAIEDAHEIKKRKLAREYALSNARYKIGDIFTDHIGSIRIELIKAYIFFKNPECVYYGLELKKDGTTPTKKMQKRDAYQNNDINKN